MRTTPDRIRHAVSFEIIGLALVMPLVAWLFGLALQQTGVIGIGGSIIAMVWTYLFNYWFDLVLRHFTGRTHKGLVLRIFHAVLYEVGLVLILMPAIAWYLGITLWQALSIDIVFAVFFMVYAFVFNLAYDRLFPLPE